MLFVYSTSPTTLIGATSCSSSSNSQSSSSLLSTAGAVDASVEPSRSCRARRLISAIRCSYGIQSKWLSRRHLYNGRIPPSIFQITYDCSLGLANTHSLSMMSTPSSAHSFIVLEMRKLCGSNLSEPCILGKTTAVSTRKLQRCFGSYSSALSHSAPTSSPPSMWKVILEPKKNESINKKVEEV